MAFTFEWILRFHRVVSASMPHNEYNAPDLSDITGRKLGLSCLSALFVHYCDEWPEKRKQVVAAMDRRGNSNPQGKC